MTPKLMEQEKQKTIKELYEQCNYNDKSMSLYMRSENNVKQLISETSYLPNDISSSERLYCYKNNLNKIPECPVCGKPRRFRKLSMGYFATCGDRKCQSALIIKANKESNRDWDKIQQKMRDTYATNHNGYTHNMQDPEAKKKYYEKYALEHNGEKCGVCSKKAKENREKTFEKHGGVRQMFEDGIIKKYGSITACATINNTKRAQLKSEKDLKEIKRRLVEMGYTYLYEEDNHIVRIKCNRCNSEFSMSRQAINDKYLFNKFNFCYKCDYKEMTFRSIFEKEIGDEIKTICNTEMIFNNQSMFGCECDIILPEYKLAIEANGIYWHTEEHKNPKCHIDKKLKVENKGYNLIQIWEDDWRDEIKKHIIISRLKSKLQKSIKIYARKCIIKEVSGTETKQFLNENHLQGYVPSQYKYGLYYNNELVEIITIGKSRKPISGKTECFELYRLCSKNGYNVIGGFSKLLKYASKKLHGHELISYADCDWCNMNNNGYESVGFEKIKITSPGYTYNINGIRQNRLNYTKKKLVNAGFDKNKTEIEIMHERGFYRIFDSGNILFKTNL